MSTDEAGLKTKCMNGGQQGVSDKEEEYQADPFIQVKKTNLERGSFVIYGSGAKAAPDLTPQDSFLFKSVIRLSSGTLQ